MLDENFYINNKPSCNNEIYCYDVSSIFYNSGKNGLNKRLVNLSSRLKWKILKISLLKV